MGTKLRPKKSQNITSKEDLELMQRIARDYASSIIYAALSNSFIDIPKLYEGFIYKVSTDIRKILK
jgi:hypothetical protein